MRPSLEIGVKMREFVKIDEKDTVAVALKPLERGKVLTVDGVKVVLRDDIPQGHKFALGCIKRGEPVIKYGFSIGHALENISQGSHVHIHNIRTSLGEALEYRYEPDKEKGTVGRGRGEWRRGERGTESKSPEFEKGGSGVFMGFKRSDKKTGVRNELWIIPTVGCVNSVARAIEREARLRFPLGEVEDIVAFTHPYGCSQMGGDQENTKRVLADMIHHPNAGGILVLGLGCENCNIPALMADIGRYDPDRVKFLQCQDCEDELNEALRLLGELYAKASLNKRVECQASELVIGMKCGGSDGLSGITANPVVGAFSDMLISRGGTTILTEVPEMFGAETILMNRCKDEETFQKTVKLINDFKEYFKRHNQTIYENPSPGNKQGGISTLEDKSLGCTQKSGTCAVCGVLEYGERVKEKGLNLLSAPGNDLVAATALAASGAQMVLFTTGRGTPFATLVPTIKIASNSKLAVYKPGWIDFNAGVILEAKSKEEVARELFQYVLMVASGKKVKSEEAGYHDLAIFKQGVTL